MNVDAIFVITLDTDKERRKKMKEWYPKKANLQWFIVKRMKNPERGCYSSHQKVLRMAKERGFKRILILEDDAYPLYSWNKIVKETNNALKYLNEKESNWKHLMLGYLPVRSKKIKDNKNLVEIICAYDTHAYIINVNNVRSVPWDGISIDNLLFCNIGKKIKNLTGNHIKITKTNNYGIHPMLITQKTEKSSIDNFHLLQKGYIDFFGGEEKMTEISTNCNTLIFGIFIILFFPLLLCLCCLGGHSYNTGIYYTKSCCCILFFLFILIIMLIITSIY